MKKFLAAALLLAAHFAASANPIYYSRCDNTAWVTSHASCVAGNDANNGLSAAAPKLTPPTSFTTGTTYLFNRAGAWGDWQRVLISTRQDVTFEAYTPASCTGDCATRKPMIATALTQNTNTCPNNAFWLSGSSARITIRGFHMIGKTEPNNVKPTTAPGGTRSSCSSAMSADGTIATTVAGIAAPSRKLT